MHTGPKEAAVDLSTDSAGNHVVLLSGEWDVGNATVIRAAFARVAASKSGLVCVDLCDTTFMDSTALHEVLVLRQRVGSRMSVRCAAGPVLRIFRLAGLTDYLSVSIR